MNRIFKPALVVMAVILAPVLALRAETGAAKAADAARSNTVPSRRPRR